MDALIRPAIEHPVQELDTRTDTRDYLAHARSDAEKKGFAIIRINSFLTFV